MHIIYSMGAIFEKYQIIKLPNYHFLLKMQLTTNNEYDREVAYTVLRNTVALSRLYCTCLLVLLHSFAQDR